MSDNKCLMMNNNRSILVLSSAELRQLEIDASKSDQEGVKIRELLGFSKIIDLEEPILQNLKFDGHLEVGNIFVRSPYDYSRYITSTEASYALAEDYCLLFTSLCARLGGKKVNTKKVEIKDLDSKHVATVDANNPSISGQLGISKLGHEKIQRIIKINREWDSNQPDIDKAKKFLERKGLSGDSLMSQLVEDSEEDVLGKKFSRELSISQETSRTLKALVSLNVPSFLSNLNTNLEITKKESYLFTVEMEVEFW